MYMIVTHILISTFFVTGLVFLYRFNRNLRGEDCELHKHVIRNHSNLYVYLKYAIPAIMFFFVFALINSCIQITLWCSMRALELSFF